MSSLKCLWLVLFMLLLATDTRGKDHSVVSGFKVQTDGFSFQLSQIEPVTILVSLVCIVASCKGTVIGGLTAQ